MQRSSEEKQGARATVRLLESLLRLSEAHARLMCKQHVTLNDAIVAVYLMSLCQASYTGIKPPLHDCLLFRATELMYCSHVCVFWLQK
jgi:DNA helicase MCM9